MHYSNPSVPIRVAEGSEARRHIAEFQAQGRRQIARPAVVLRHLDGMTRSVHVVGVVRVSKKQQLS